MAAMNDATQAGQAPEAAVARSSEDQAQITLRLVAASARLNALALVTVAALIVLGVWMHYGVKQSLQEVRAGGLRTVLEAVVKAMQLWVDDRKADAAHWANGPVVRRHAAELVSLARSGADGAALWNTPARTALEEVLRPVMKETGAVAFNIIDAGGLIVATQFPEYAGRRVNPGMFLAQISAVFTSGPRFIRPFPERERIGVPPVPEFSRPVVWFAAPLRDERNEVIAALSFAYYADGKYSGILQVARPGQSGEAYAFDAGGLMLSESRFTGELRKAGVLRGQANAMFQLQVRDPGGSLAAGFRPPLEMAARPLTQLVAIATASRGKDSAAEQQGVILDPYRNYRGTEVIGAWRWLAEYDLGVAMEMEAKEAYAPLGYVNAAFMLILCLLIAALLVALWSSFYVRRLRRQIGESRQIGQYRLQRQLGEGGMGTVYLAHHALLKRPTALKMLKPHLATDEVAARFQREAQLASQLVHPNTVEIYDYGRTPEGGLYYVMEYLDGLTLDRVVGEHGALPPARVIRILAQVCGALREAHGRGLVHRDIKPHNIMLCRRGGEDDVAKILDFGLVKDTSGQQSRDITQFQKTVGTPLYMSPERIRNPADADARADIYSVGAVGFYLLTARHLFEAGGEHDLIYQVLHTPAPRASQFAAVPERLDDLLARCVAKDRSERPHDMVVVLATLETLAIAYPWTQREASAWWQRHAPATPEAGVANPKAST